MKTRVLLLLASVLLAGCAIEGGVPPATPPGNPPALSTPLAATAPAEPERPTWTIGLVDEPASLYPYAATRQEGRARAPISELLFPAPVLTHGFSYTVTSVLERLPTIENGGASLRDVEVYLDAAGNITTTATEVITTRQQIVLTYTLQPDQFWADGTPLTAADSVFAYEAARAAPPGEEARDRLALIEQYEALDDRTVQVVLKPDYTEPYYVDTFWTPLPRHLLAELAPEELPRSAFAGRPLGYGPYTFGSAGPGEVRLVRNPYYRGPPPAADEVVFLVIPGGFDALRQAVVAGAIDVTALETGLPVEPSPLLRQDVEGGLVRALSAPGPIWEHLDFNLNSPALQDLRVRRAIAHAIDRQRMSNEIFDGNATVLNTWLLPGQWAAAPADQLRLYPYDPDEARRLLEEAGFSDPEGDGLRMRADGLPLNLQLMVAAASPVRERMAAMIASDLQQVGIQVDLLLLPGSEMYGLGGPLKLRQFDMALFAWIAGPDPAGRSMWSCEAIPRQDNDFVGDNYAGWCFRDANQAIATATLAFDPAERAAAYLRHQQLFTQEMPILPLLQRPILVMTGPDVRGVQPDALAPITWNIAEWRREP